MHIPHSRIRTLVHAPPRPTGRHVLVYMVATRRLSYTYTVQRGVALAREHGVPLVILEALRCGYRHASDRHHAFILDGMAEHARRLAGTPVLYHPWVEPRPGAGRGLLEAWARNAVAVVTDDWPGFFIPNMLTAAARQVHCAFEAVDSAGLLPLSASPRPFKRAVDFRRFFQKAARPHLAQPPVPDPIALLPTHHPRLHRIPSAIAARWPPAPPALLDARPAALAALPIDHTVAPVDLRGGTSVARRLWRRFRQTHLRAYTSGTRTMSADRTSGLSPYLHHGHISVHELVADIAAQSGPLPPPTTTATGKRHGWWGQDDDVEAFLDQVVTWRELALHHAHHVPDGARYETLPAWARATLEDHATDPRPVLLTLDQLTHGGSPDPVWNAAQHQLVRHGRIQSYLRMVWGKRILEWTPSPRDALRTLFQLNDRFALDGRDPSSVANLMWVLGRFDRAWGPERPIFGKLRFMSSTNTLRKLRCSPAAIRAWTPTPGS